MAEEVVVTGTTKTDPAEMSSRQKWQASMASHLQEQTVGQANFADTMKNMMGDFKTDEALAQQTKMSGLLTSVKTASFKTANLLEGYIDFMKDAERKRLEAAMEAARQKKGGKGGKDGELATKKDEMEDSWSTLSTILAGTLATMGAGFLAFKTKWGSWWSDSATTLDEMGKPKAGFFKKLKGFFGFGDDAKDIKDLGKARSGFFFKLGKYFGFNQAMPDELTKKKTGFFDNIKKFLKFDDATEATSKSWKGNFTKQLSKMMAWAGDTESLTDASKLKFMNMQQNMLKWADDAEGIAGSDKAKFLKKQSKMLTWMADHTDGIDKNKIKFLKDQSKMLAWADDAADLSKADKIKFLKNQSKMLDIGEGAIDASKVAKDSFFAKQLKMLGLNPSDVDGVELKKQGMFSKLKGKIFNIGDDISEAVTKAKTSFSGRMGNFFKMPMFDEGSTLMKMKTGFLTGIDNVLGTLWKIVQGFFKLVNVMSFGTLGFLSPESLAKPTETFKSIKASTAAAFGPEGIFTKVAKTFKSIMAPLGDWMKPIKGILKVVKTIGKIFGRIFIPIGILFSAFDVISNVMKGYEEGGITGAIGAGIESIFDDVLMFIPNLLGEAVAWILEKMGFDNAVKFIDENLRDADGNFSLFNGIKNLFSYLGEAISNIWDKLMNFLSWDNIMTMMGASLIKQGNTTVAGMLLSDEMEERAKIRAKVGEDQWAKLREKEIEAEKQKAALADAKASKQQGGVGINDQSSVVHNYSMPTVREANAAASRDPIRKKKN